MTDTASLNIIERLRAVPTGDPAVDRVIIPFHDDAIFLRMVNEAVLILEEQQTSDLVLVVDAHTCNQLHNFDALRSMTSRIYVNGSLPALDKHAENISPCPPNSFCRSQDQLFLLLSPDVAMAILGSPVVPEHRNGSGYIGGWTVDPHYVVSAFAAVLCEEAEAVLGAMELPESTCSQLDTAALKMMSFHANVMAHRQQDISMDKNDLSSVLNILKAMTAKRCVHDILYVFVEQIAKVVSSERCSVLRVWTNDSEGQVLASHEDASITDHAIKLEKYPEVCEAIRTGKKVVVNDVRNDPLTQSCAKALDEAHINSMLVIPIVLHDENVGSLLLRAARREQGFTLREINFFEIVTEAAANALERAHLIETIQLANENLERLAITDGLTGLYNHRYFKERLKQEVDRCLRYGVPMGCLIFDVDDFKQCNDTYGHLVGDSILREMGRRVMRCIRRSDLVARYGGEEFVVLLPQTDAKGSLGMGERIRKVICDTPFEAIHGGGNITVSVGIGIFDAATMKSAEDIIEQADKALYTAKRTGKNKAVGPEDLKNETD